MHTPSVHTATKPRGVTSRSRCPLLNGSEFTVYERFDVPGEGTKSHCVTVSCQFGPGTLDDTKVITVFPRYAVVNKLDADVLFRAQSPDGLNQVEEQLVFLFKFNIEMGDISFMGSR